MGSIFITFLCIFAASSKALDNRDLYKQLDELDRSMTEVCYYRILLLSNQSDQPSDDLCVCVSFINAIKESRVFIDRMIVIKTVLIIITSHNQLPSS